jgi:hypothetical protein
VVYLAEKPSKPVEEICIMRFYQGKRFAGQIGQQPNEMGLSIPARNRANGFAIQGFAYLRDAGNAVYVQMRALPQPFHYLILKFQRRKGFKCIGNLQNKIVVVFCFQPEVLIPFTGQFIALAVNAEQFGSNLFRILDAEAGCVLDDGGHVLVWSPFMLKC